MKILGICFPNDLFYTTLKNDQTSWYGQGIWSILKIMDLVHDPHLKIVTNLSSSSSTHPILQTVMDSCVDLVPLEVGMTSKRFEYMDFTNSMVFAEIFIISKKIMARQIRNFIVEIFDLWTMMLIFFSFLTMTFIIWFSNILINTK